MWLPVGTRVSCPFAPPVCRPSALVEWRPSRVGRGYAVIVRALLGVGVTFAFRFVGTGGSRCEQKSGPDTQHRTLAKEIRFHRDVFLRIFYPLET